MSDLVPANPDKLFELADRISQSPLMPPAYRNKPVDAAVAMMYGQEVGLPPMTALQRIVVINGKPTLDAQGMVALIRAAGHSLVGGSDEERAEVVGVRRDTGDTMKVEFTMEDAKRAGLVRRDSPWTKFPKSMLWARAVSQLARELFADVLLGMSYVPEEMEAVEGTAYQKGRRAMHTPDGIVEVDADLANALKGSSWERGDPETGEIIEIQPDQLNKADMQPDIDEAEEERQAMSALAEIISEVVPDALRQSLQLFLKQRYGKAGQMNLDQIREATRIAAGWPQTGEPEPEEALF